MSEVDVRIRFVVGETADLAREATDKLREIWATKFLRERGFSVTPPNKKWETPKEFFERVGVRHESLRRALRRPDRPNVMTHRTATGRLLTICSNADFDAFVKRHKTPEKKHS